MQIIKTTADLRQAIILLENNHSEEGLLYREQLLSAFDYIQPVNILKRTIQNIGGSGDAKTHLLDTTIGMGIGYASKSLFENYSLSPVKKLIGTILLFGLTKGISNYPEILTKVGGNIANTLKNLTKKVLS